MHKDRIVHSTNFLAIDILLALSGNYDYVNEN